MKARIRIIAHKRKGVVTESETIVEKQSISVGRATDRDIFLSDSSVGYDHARINLLPNGSVSVTSSGRLGFYIEGKLVQNCLIQQSGAILIGVYQILIRINKKQGLTDITIEKTSDGVIEEQDERSLPIRLEQTWLSKRALCWLGFLLPLVLFLGLPLAEFYSEPAERLIAEYKLPDDRLWLSGEISEPHRHFGGDCNQCHQQPFVKVTDSACLACHQQITAHADPASFDLPALRETRCASCHREHSGSEHLVQRAQTLCVTCHSRLDGIADGELTAISDFATDHSQFRVSLITRAGLSRYNPEAWQRVSLDDPAIRHETGLVFPHNVHLDAAGIRSPNGERVLQCNDCHRADVSGNYMQPITMEAHCSSCHRLEFDPDDLDRELPHSDLPNLRKMLNEYYSLKALRGGIGDADAPDLVTERRRPGKALTRAEQEVALQWALEKAEQVAEEVVEFRSCNLCHKVERDPSITAGWRIAEVNTAQSRWLTRGHFDHHSHRGSQCQTCHAADASARSEDVLLPGIDVCRDCHGGEQSEDKLRSTCIVCHDFHQPHRPLMELTRGEGVE